MSAQIIQPLEQETQAPGHSKIAIYYPDAEVGQRTACGCLHLLISPVTVHSTERRGSLPI